MQIVSGMTDFLIQLIEESTRAEDGDILFFQFIKDPDLLGRLIQVHEYLNIKGERTDDAYF